MTIPGREKRGKIMSRPGRRTAAEGKKEAQPTCRERKKKGGERGEEIGGIFISPYREKKSPSHQY